MQKAITAASFLSIGGIVSFLLAVAAEGGAGRVAFVVILTTTSVLFLSSGAVGLCAFLFGQSTLPRVQLWGIRILWVVSIPLIGMSGLAAGFVGLEFAALASVAAVFLILAALALSFFVRKPMLAATHDSWTNCPMCGEPANHDYCSCPKCGEPRGSGPTAR